MCLPPLQGQRKRFPVRLSRRDRREVVHVSNWRMVNPGILIGAEWSKDIGLSRIRDGVGRFVPHPIEPPAPVVPAAPVGVGTGLDAAALEAAKKKEEKPKKKDRKEKAVDSEASSSKKSVGKVLHDKASINMEREESERMKKKRKRAHSSRREKKRVTRGSDDSSEVSSGLDDDSSDESVFQVPLSRGGLDLHRVSKRHPGKLLRSGLEEMGRYTWPTGLEKQGKKSHGINVG